MNKDVQFENKDWDSFIQNDSVGSPRVYDYTHWFNNYLNVSNKRVLSPTTVRYVKVLQDIIFFSLIR